MRGPAASRYTGVGVALRFLRRVEVAPNPTSSPASNRRRSLTASRMKARPARGCPMLRVEMKPGATVRQVRPGAISSRLWASEARTSGWRTTGLDVAGNSCRRCVARTGRQRQSQVGIATAGRVVVDADPVEPRIFAAADECSNVGQRLTNRNSQRDADAGHIANSSIPPRGRATVKLRNSDTP